MSGEDDALFAKLTSNDDRHSFRPVLFDLGVAHDRRALATLLHERRDVVVHDTLRDQLGELVVSRNPARELDAAQLEDAVSRHLEGRALATYGRWVYYPWARRLVHALPPDEHFFLRSDRNRFKISLEEQRRLRGFTVGVVGLSVGQASAVTLAMEGVGGRFRLADFDVLSLSNVNRLRAGIHDVGVPKTVLAAREMFEIDPYLSIELFSDGVGKENAERFFTGDGRLDLLVEECDDLHAKVSLREIARAHRIPVVMETSDRGLVDVERFDREPHRPILHGLLGELRAESLARLSTKEKVPHVLRILDDQRVSSAFAASLVEVKETIHTWPQLASAIALGGAIVTDVARRILLDRFHESGRFYVDLENLVRDGSSVPLAPSAPTRETTASLLVREPLPVPPREGPSLSHAEARFLVGHAILAPSGGNMQPWRFEHRGDTLLCFLDDRRTGSFLDYGDSASVLAIGAAVENLAIAAETIGFDAQVSPFPDPGQPRLIAAITLARGAHGDRTSSHDRLALVRNRVTNRRFGEPKALSEDDAHALSAAAAARGVHLRLTSARDAMSRVADVLGRCDRLRFVSEPMHRDLMSELRWTDADARESRTGIELPSLELPPSDEAAMRILSRWSTMDYLRSFGGGKALERPAAKTVAASSALGLLSIRGISPSAYLAGGRGMQSVWLEATSRNIALQPYSSLLYLLARAERGGGVGLDESARGVLASLRGELAAVFPTLGDHTELLLFRVSYAGAPTSRALRLDVDDVLTSST